MENTVTTKAKETLLPQEYEDMYNILLSFLKYKEDMNYDIDNYDYGHVGRYIDSLLEESLSNLRVHKEDNYTLLVGKKVYKNRLYDKGEFFVCLKETNKGQVQLTYEKSTTINEIKASDFIYVSLENYSNILSTNMIKSLNKYFNSVTK